MSGFTQRSCLVAAIMLATSMAVEMRVHALSQSGQAKPQSPPADRPPEKPSQQTPEKASPPSGEKPRQDPGKKPEPRPEPKPEPKPEPRPEQRPVATPPVPPAKPTEGGKSLDELLGIPTSGKTGDTPATADGQGGAKPDEDPAARAARERLQRGLDEKELDSLLHQALSGMQTSAEQLADRTETGLTTQRVQADVVAKLDQLIEEAKRRSKNSQSKSSSGSSSSQSGQKQQQGNAQKQGEQDGNKPGESKTRIGSQRSKSGDGNREGEGPAPVDPDKDQAAMDESQAEWGALPERVRDLIRQGSRDRIASLYQRLTQEYYRRMAEDASR